MSELNPQLQTLLATWLSPELFGSTSTYLSLSNLVRPKSNHLDHNRTEMGSCVFLWAQLKTGLWFESTILDPHGVWVERGVYNFMRFGLKCTMDQAQIWPIYTPLFYHWSIVNSPPQVQSSCTWRCVSCNGYYSARVAACLCWSLPGIYPLFRIQTLLYVIFSIIIWGYWI